MHDPENYDKLKLGTKLIGAQLIPPLLEKMKMKFGKQQRILDFGSGTSKTASMYLLPLAEDTDSEIVGLDISEEMIEYARNMFINQRMKFICGNILSDEFRIQESSFDHIFSFCVLHWVQDYREALKRFYKILKPGGKCGIILAATHNMFSSFKFHGQDSEWKMYMDGYAEFCPDWIETENPAEMCKESYGKAIVDAGFNILQLTLRRECYVYETLDFYAAFMLTLNPFVDVAPKAMHTKLKDSIRSHICRMGEIPDNKEFHSKPYEETYQTLTIVMEKPE